MSIAELFDSAGTVTKVKAITIRRPDDWHVHLRDGAMLKAVLPFTEAQFAREGAEVGFGLSEVILARCRRVGRCHIV